MHTSTARRLAAAAVMACGTLFAGSAAQASNVQWSVGISAPLYPGHVGAVISDGPYYGPPPVYVRPAPIYYYAPPPVYYRPVPVVVHRWGPPSHHGSWHRGHHDRWHGRGYNDHRWHDRGHHRGGYHHNGHRHDRHDGWKR
jgi:hypothetical protein